MTENWLLAELDRCARLVAAHPLPGPVPLPSTLSADALAGGIALLRQRLTMLEGEAHRRGLLTGVSRPLKIPALVGCQVEACAEEVSYPLDMVRRWQDRPICEQCYDDGARPADAPAWADLPSIDLSDLRE